MAKKLWFAAALMRSATPSSTKDICFIKNPHSKCLTPGHHDLSRYRMQGARACGK